MADTTQEIRYTSLEDLVFENRNKEYGAYDLRKRYRRYLLLAFLISFVVISVSVVTPLIQAYYNRHKKVNVVAKNVNAVLENINNDEEAPPPPPPPPPPAALETQVKFAAPVVVDTVKEEEVNTMDIADDNIKNAVSEAPPEELTTVVEEKKEAVVDEVEPAFIVVEESATFQGGDLNTFRNWIQTNLVYPQQAAENGSEGRVFIQFAVNSRGEICDIKVLRSAGDPMLDNEAVRVMKQSPKWTAARQGGSPVKQQFTLPIVFKLQ